MPGSSPEPRVSLVIGGTRGIGRSIAAGLRDAGHRVAVIARNLPADPLEAVEYLTGDVIDEERCATALDDAVARVGPPNDVVFSQRFRGDGDDFAGELDLALAVPRRVIEALADRLPAGASIVAVSSVNARYVSPPLSAGYHVAKAGLRQLVRYYAVRLGPSGVRVNCVSPGTVVKGESADFYARDHGATDAVRRVTPLGRLGTAEDVANAVAFLCGPRADFVTGQEIIVDGGASLQLQEQLSRELG